MIPAGWHHTDDSAMGEPLPFSVFLDNGGVAAGMRSPLRVVRLADKGNPPVDDLIRRAKEWHARGCKVKLLNELNNPVEQWQGGPIDYERLWRAVNAGAPEVDLLWQSPSPGFPTWRGWLPQPTYQGSIAVNCYGTFAQMRSNVTDVLNQCPEADLYITEFNAGWGQHGVDLGRWVDEHARPFLAWLFTNPEVKGAAYFAARWNNPDMAGQSLDGLGTPVESLLYAVASQERPSAPETPPQEETPVSDEITKWSHHKQPRRGRSVRYVVMHTTEGNSTFSQATDYLIQNSAEVSAHYLVGPAQTVEMVPLGDAANHAGWETVKLPNGARGVEGNLQTVGIEMYNRKGEKPQAATVERAAQLVARLLPRLGLGVESIIAHRDVDPTRRSDPTGVDMPAFRQQVARLMEQPHPGPQWDKVDWLMEQAARNARAENLMGAYDTILNKVIPAVKKMR